MADDARNISYWIDTAPAPAFPSLEGEIEVDVAIVGGGMVGVTLGRLLKDEGLKVAVVEARTIGGEVTGKSTAKITSQHNITYTKLEKTFGEDGARAYAEANEAGLALILKLAAENGVDCDIERKPAFTYTLDEKETEAIEREAALAAKLGLPASVTRDTGLPFAVAAAMRWDNQAQFHPVKYAAGLAATIPGGGCHVFQNSRVIDWDPRRIATERGAVKARHVVMATHLPLGHIGLFYAEAYPHIHPVIAGRVEAGRAPDGMYLKVEQPRHSVRSHRGADGQTRLVFAGPAFKAGHVDDERKNFAEIERFAQENFGVRAEHRWTNEDYTSMDGAPFVGWSSSMRGYLVATGFNAWGLTNGAAAAIMISDIIAGRENRWLDLYDATRIKPVASAKEFVKGNIETASHLVGGYMTRRPKSFDTLEPGKAAVLKIDGDHVAAYRDDSGKLHAVSAVCTHMGCILGWNETDRTWDCPCHGSRFEHDGEVLHGPAAKRLEPLKGASGPD